ncbi:MAG: hypothetical protein MJK04_07070 [Psychrosphaera sp.]|nr:hypothetical protein [Psychrosphaera sp.]
MKSHTEIAVASIRCFSDDGTLDIGELNFLLGLALRDGVVDDEEKRVLNNIFSKVGQTDVTPIVWDRIKEIKQQHNL